MLLRALRAGGLLLLTLALSAGPAMTAGAAAAKKKPSTTARTAVRKPAVRQGTALTRTKSKSRAARRPVRRRRASPPAGGVYARNAILIDPRSGEVLFEKNSARSVPIASLTKLMTALVFVEQKPRLTREVEVTAREIEGGGHTQLRTGERARLGDLLHMSLMCSDNVATRVLARESGLTPDDFVARMNRKAVELGLTGTRFSETTGLDERNVSTASDVARLLHAAAHDSRIQDIVTTRQFEFRTERRAHFITNTNRLLLYGPYEVLGGKTGFIVEAGYCFATWVRAEGRDLIAVVLGAPTASTRFADTMRLIQKAQPAAPTQRSRA